MGNKENKYSMVVSWSVDDSAYIVRVPELAGCLADGKTRELAVRNAETIINEWIETARENGEKIPDPILYHTF